MSVVLPQSLRHMHKFRKYSAGREKKKTMFPDHPQKGKGNRAIPDPSINPVTILLVNPLIMTQACVHVIFNPEKSLSYAPFSSVERGHRHKKM